MKRLLLFAAFAASTYAQQFCSFTFNFTQGTGFGSQPSPTAFDNRLKGCGYWTVNYQVTGLSAVSVQLNQAGGANTFGSFSIFGGTVISGTNPLTSVVNNTNTQAVLTGYAGWLQIQVSGTPSASTWNIRGTVTGLPPGSAVNPATGSGACPSAGAASCFVQGAGANGAAAVGNPVLLAGSDGANARTLLTSAAGRPAVNQQANTVAQTDANTNTANVPLGDNGNPLQTPILNQAYNGTTWDRQRVASLANFPATVGGATNVSAGALVVEKGGRSNAASAPATGNAASASVAANATARHVLDCVTFAARSTAASTATNILLNIRDGASGAGTVVQSLTIASIVSAAAGVQVIPVTSFCGLNIVGTTNTAMTVEFSAGVANTDQSINFTFFNVQ